MKVKIRDLTIQQWRKVCDKSFCTTCQLHDFCILESNDGLDKEINVPDDLPQKSISPCRYRNEDECSMYCSGFDTTCEDYEPMEEE